MMSSKTCLYQGKSGKHGYEPEYFGPGDFGPGDWSGKAGKHGYDPEDFQGKSGKHGYEPWGEDWTDQSGFLHVSFKL